MENIDFLKLQKDEATGMVIYRKLAKRSKAHREVLEKIANDEEKHYNMLKKITGKDVGPSRFKVFVYILLAKILGLTFALKLMEKGEELAQSNYSINSKALQELLKDEEEHERVLIALIDEERLYYIGSMVLGLNDAIVELTGTLAGLTFAIQKTSIVALSGIITGIAAAFSMAASNYLAEKADENSKKPLKSAAYTGFAYLVTVFLLTFPFLINSNPFIALTFSVINAVLIIAIFNFFIYIVKEESFKKNFLEMLGISFGVVILSFVVGLIARKFLGIEI